MRPIVSRDHYSPGGDQAPGSGLLLSRVMRCECDINEEMAVTACGRELSGERPVMLSEITGGQYSHIRTDPSLRSGGDTATGTGAHIMMISTEL